MYLASAGARIVAKRVPLPLHRIYRMISDAKSCSGPPRALPVLPLEIEDLHREAVLQKRSSYVDPETGYDVITSYAHEKRGTCCGNQCRHCPFEYVNVKEKPVRSFNFKPAKK